MTYDDAVDTVLNAFDQLLATEQVHYALKHVALSRDFSIFPMDYFDDFCHMRFKGNCYWLASVIIASAERWDFCLDEVWCMWCEDKGMFFSGNSPLDFVGDVNGVIQDVLKGDALEMFGCNNEEIAEIRKLLTKDKEGASVKSTLEDSINGKSIVKLEKAGKVEWMVCDDFDAMKPENSASCFDSLLEAVKYANTKEDDALYLVTLSPDYGLGDIKYGVVKGRDRALAYVMEHKSFLSCKDITEELKELEYKNAVQFGDEFGAVYIEKYELGVDIG